MTWEKGQSGNPAGRTKKAMAIMRQMEGLTFKAVKAYEHALDHGTISEKMAAANAVMDRVHGKPKQQATLSVEHNASPHLAALMAIANQSLARIQTHPSDHAKPLILDDNLNQTMKPVLSLEHANVDVDAD